MDCVSQRACEEQVCQQQKYLNFKKIKKLWQQKQKEKKEMKKEMKKKKI